MTIVAWLPAVLYGAAAAAYMAHFARRQPRLGRAATALLGAGVLAHTFLIGMQTVQAGYAPLVGTTAAVSAFVCCSGSRISTSSCRRTSARWVRSSPR